MENINENKIKPIFKDCIFNTNITHNSNFILNANIKDEYEKLRIQYIQLQNDYSLLFSKFCIQNQITQEFVFKNNNKIEILNQIKDAKPFLKLDYKKLIKDFKK